MTQLSISNMKKEDVKVFEIELTGTCNLDCVLCARNFDPMQDKKQYNQRPLVDIIKQLDEYPNIEECCIAGHITEPTLYRELLGLLDYLNKRNIKKEFYTNSDLHGKKYWEELAQHFLPIDEVYFTVCGSTQELHEKYRVNSNLNTVIENALYFKNACPHPIDYIQHIMFEYNKEDFDSCIMQDIIASFSNTYLINSLQYNNRFEVVDKDSDIQMTKELRQKYAAISQNGKNAVENDGIILCKSLQENFIDIDQFGNVHPCFLHRMSGPSFDINNYNKILNGEYDFCFECEAKTIKLLDIFEMERIG